MFSVGTSKVILKIEAILSFIFGGILCLVALVALVAGGFIVDAISKNAPQFAAISAYGGIALFIILAILAVLCILFGVWYLKASRDVRNIGPAFVISIIGLVGAVFNVIGMFTTGFSIWTLLSSVWNVVVFLAALSIKKSRA